MLSSCSCHFPSSITSCIPQTDPIELVEKIKQTVRMLTGEEIGDLTYIFLMNSAKRGELEVAFDGDVLTVNEITAGSISRTWEWGNAKIYNDITGKIKF